MKIRLGSLALLLAIAPAFAGDGLDPRRSAADYPVQVTSGKLIIGAAYIPPAQVKKIFGDDLDKRGYVVFEIGVFPQDNTQFDISPDDFKLRQGKDTSLSRATTPHDVAVAVHPHAPTPPPAIPGNVHVTTVETIGYEKGPYGHGVYTSTAAEVGVGKDPRAPLPPPPSAPSAQSQAELETQLEAMSLPETKTEKPVAGYIYFAKPTADKRADFEILYFGLDGQVTLKVTH